MKPDAADVERRIRAAADRKLRRQMGRPLTLSDAAIDQAAQVGDSDAAIAAAAWDRDSELAGLLDAEVIEATA